MALIDCQECGKQISDKALSCPGCGAPIVPSSDAMQNTQKPAPTVDAKPAASSSPVTYGIVALVGIFMLARCVGSGGGASGGDTASRGLDWNDALVMCQMAIQKSSRDPEKADVPFVPNQGSGDEYRYTWGPSTKLARMRNGFGLEVGVPATCVVSGAQKRITSLVIDGQKIL